MSKKKIKVDRTFPQYDEETFKKIQTLQSIVATNNETAIAYSESIKVHNDGITSLKGKQGVDQLVQSFEAAINSHVASRDHLMKWNEVAKKVIEKHKILFDFFSEFFP